MLVRDVKGKKRMAKCKGTALQYDPKLNSENVQYPPASNVKNKSAMKLPPANMSATVKLITKNKPLLRRQLFFIKRMIEIRFPAIITADSIMPNDSQVTHSDEEKIMNIAFS